MLAATASMLVIVASLASVAAVLCAFRAVLLMVQRRALSRRTARSIRDVSSGRRWTIGGRAITDRSVADPVTGEALVFFQAFVNVEGRLGTSPRHFVVTSFSDGALAVDDGTGLAHVTLDDDAELDCDRHEHRLDAHDMSEAIRAHLAAELPGLDYEGWPVTVNIVRIRPGDHVTVTGDVRTRTRGRGPHRTATATVEVGGHTAPIRLEDRSLEGTVRALDVSRTRALVAAAAALGVAMVASITVALIR